MKISTLDRAIQIRHRLESLATARERLNDADLADSLSHFLATRRTAAQKDVGFMPGPIATFKRACLDAIATEEAVLKQEFEAL